MLQLFDKFGILCIFNCALFRLFHFCLGCRYGWNIFCCVSIWMYVNVHESYVAKVHCESFHCFYFNDHQKGMVIERKKKRKYFDRWNVLTDRFVFGINIDFSAIFTLVQFLERIQYVKIEINTLYRKLSVES